MFPVHIILFWTVLFCVFHPACLDLNGIHALNWLDPESLLTKQQQLRVNPARLKTLEAIAEISFYNFITVVVTTAKI